MKFLGSHLVTDDEYKHLTRLASDTPFPFKKDETTRFFEQELRRLRALGFIAGHLGKGVRSMLKTGGDVKDHFRITDQGRVYLTLRQKADGEEDAPNG